MNKEHRAFVEQYLANPRLPIEEGRWGKLPTPAGLAKLDEEIKLLRILLRRVVAQLRRVEMAPVAETKAQAIDSGLYALPEIVVTMGGARQFKGRHTTKLTRRRERSKLVRDIMAYSREIARLENLRCYLYGPVVDLGDGSPEAFAMALRLMEF